jgi:transcriptional regulatory protein GAL4
MVYAVCFSSTPTRAFLTFYRYFLFQAGLIPVVFLMTDPSNPDASSWLQDIETTKALLNHPSFGTNRFAARCSEVINRLLGSPSGMMTEFGFEGQPPNPQQQVPQVPQQGFMPFPEQLFNDPGFGGSLFPIEQQMPTPGGMDFSEWVNFPNQ